MGSRERLSDGILDGLQNAIRRLSEVPLAEGNVSRGAAEGIYESTSYVLDDCLSLRFLDAESSTLIHEVLHAD